MKSTPKLILAAANKLLKPTGLKLVHDISSMRSSYPREIHFLHIGKNAGTAIASLLSYWNQQCSDIGFVKHSHSVRLRDLPPPAEYFFSIRNPVSRFVSAFYSRKRKGLPRFHFEWSPDEELAFKTFEHATNLAEYLFLTGPAEDLQWLR